MKRSVCIHAHFYQPPRENPWLEEVELQDSAYPYHDWNSRVTAECYAPNTASRILNNEKKIVDIVNNYSRISFNFGPSLLAWLHRRRPDVYQAIIDADIQSRSYFSGHGSAMAQCYNHMIMPLSNSRDKRTQVVWGMEDFRYRFSREPEGMWLPETAVDLETLDIMAELGIKFTILSPGQAKRVRKLGSGEWEDVSSSKVDPKRPYLCKLASGRQIVVFFYDGPISQDIAFGSLLSNGENFAKRLVSTFDNSRQESQLCHIATDGETYGHHQRFGEMALSYCLYSIESEHSALITVYAQYLENNPPEYEVEVFENSSWSCFHGVERWRSDCGCNSGGHKDWNQSWRAPLRGALDWLRDNLIHIYEEQASRFLKDPWKARDDYISVVLERSDKRLEAFISTHAKRRLTHDDTVKLLQLMEMQRNAMLMYTSCGWFFDEISGIETVQIMHYAARAMQLAKSSGGISLEEAFVNLLERAPSNIAEFVNGAKVYELFVKPVELDLLRVGVHYAVSSLFSRDNHKDITQVYSYTVRSSSYEYSENGKLKLATGRISVRSNVTLESGDISFAVLHLGDHSLTAAAREFMGEESFEQMKGELKDYFAKGDIAQAMRSMDKHFNNDTYSLWHLFKDEQRRVVSQILDTALIEVGTSFRAIYEHHFSLMQAVQKTNVPFPKAFSSIAEFVLNSDIRSFLEAETLDMEKLNSLIENIERFSLGIDKMALSFTAIRRINSLMEKFYLTPKDLGRIKELIVLLKASRALSLELNLWKAQNIYFSMAKTFYPDMQEKSASGDKGALEWVENFNQLGDFLKARIA